MNLRTLFGLLFVPVLGIACADPPPPRSPPPAGIESASFRTTCALGITNATVTYEDTSTGAKLTFATSPEHVTELRERAYDSASAHGSGQHLGHGHDGKHGEGGRKHGVQPSLMPPVSAGVEETPDGARITFTPLDANDLEAMRVKLKTRVETMMTSCKEQVRRP